MGPKINNGTGNMIFKFLVDDKVVQKLNTNYLKPGVINQKLHSWVPGEQWKGIMSRSTLFWLNPHLSPIAVSLIAQLYSPVMRSPTLLSSSKFTVFSTY